jgi:hypothetical protein
VEVGGGPRPPFTWTPACHMTSIMVFPEAGASRRGWGTTPARGRDLPAPCQLSPSLRSGSGSAKGDMI